MQENGLNNIQSQYCCPPQQGPNAVSINIYSPAAYSGAPNCAPQNSGVTNPYSFYNPSSNNMTYPNNYNNLINYPNKFNVTPQNNPQPVPLNNNASGNTPLQKQETAENKKDNKEKKIVPLTDNYIKSLENYMDSNSAKVRLSAVKEILERFKEDESRKDNPSLIPLLNKALKDSSPSVRFLALTALQLGYTKGNEETVQLLNNLVASSKENYGEDAALASDALLKIATPEAVKTEGGM